MDIAKKWARDGKVPENKKMLLQAMEHVRYDPFSHAWREAKELHINPAMDRVFKGKEKPGPAIEGIIDKVNELLKEKI